MKDLPKTQDSFGQTNTGKKTKISHDFSNKFHEFSLKNK